MLELGLEDELELLGDGSGGVVVKLNDGAGDADACACRGTSLLP
ncbi:hypothetical protein AGMMS49531_10160 [Endomicrobiia bacterium]|nr:hypothetical protein AGMMS49531_10160 [Endomicrobiia bacterium]